MTIFPRAFEYKTICVDDREEPDEELNLMGQDGWFLVTSHYDSWHGQMQYTFARPVTKPNTTND